MMGQMRLSHRPGWMATVLRHCSMVVFTSAYQVTFGSHLRTQQDRDCRVLKRGAHIVKSGSVVFSPAPSRTVHRRNERAFSVHPPPPPLSYGVNAPDGTEASKSILSSASNPNLNTITDFTIIPLTPEDPNKRGPLQRTRSVSQCYMIGLIPTFNLRNTSLKIFWPRSDHSCS
jgi:hypothetical protein